MPTADQVFPAVDTAAADRRLSSATAEERVRWAVEQFGSSLVMSTSFGAQSAAMLHLVPRIAPETPVVFVDTGYLFPETYGFADLLAARLRINLRVYRAVESPAWIEARHGRLWEQGEAGIDAFNQIVKVEPMRRALNELGARAWLAGLRRAQSGTRERLPVVGVQTGILPGIAESVREARALVREALGADCPAVDAVVLCVSELVTNSVLYTRSGRPGGVVKVTVDTGDGEAT